MRKNVNKEMEPVIATRMPVADVKMLKRMARQEDRPLGSMIRVLLREAIEARSSKRDGDANAA